MKPTHILLSPLSARRGGGLTYIGNIVAGFPTDEGHRLSVRSAAPMPGLPEQASIRWRKSRVVPHSPAPKALIQAGSGHRRYDREGRSADGRRPAKSPPKI